MNEPDSRVAAAAGVAGNLNWQTLLLLLTTIGLLSVGQILFKRASAVIDFSRPQTFLAPDVFFALCLYGVATLLWMFILGRVRLSVAFPFYGLSFLFVPVLAHFFLGESLSPRVLLGGAVILAGVILATSGALGD